MYKFVVIDFETTGIDPAFDEILSVSIINEDGIVLLDEYCKPELVSSWEAAQAVNGITPEMVADKKSFGYYRIKVEDILKNAEYVVAYNAKFESDFLESYDIHTSDFFWIDPMIVFAEIYGEWNEYYQNYKWQKLSKCAEYYGYEFKAHDSLEDVKATLFCLNKMIENGDINVSK